MPTFFIILSGLLAFINFKGLILSYNKMSELSTTARDEIQNMSDMFANFMIAFSLLVFVLFLVISRKLSLITTDTIYILLFIKVLFMIDEKLYFTKAKEYSIKRFIIEKSEALSFLVLIIFCVFTWVKISV